MANSRGNSIRSFCCTATPRGKPSRLSNLIIINSLWFFNVPIFIRIDHYWTNNLLCIGSVFPLTKLLWINGTSFFLYMYKNYLRFWSSAVIIKWLEKSIQNIGFNLITNSIFHYFLFTLQTSYPLEFALNIANFLVEW